MFKKNNKVTRMIKSGTATDISSCGDVEYNNIMKHGGYTIVSDDNDGRIIKTDNGRILAMTYKSVAWYVFN